MFELGADTGDAPGEYQFWVEREHLDQVLPFPAGYRDLRMNSNGVLAVLTGEGTAKAAATIMALGLDPRFDLSKAYWVVAGIAGADPAKSSLGSAVWTDYVVDGDLGYEIDAREIPAGWTTGYIPLGKKSPFEPPAEAKAGSALPAQSRDDGVGLPADRKMFLWRTPTPSAPAAPSLNRTPHVSRRR